MSVAEKQITLCGHGSGTPSKKVMSTYLSSRYNMLAKNGKHKGVVKVMRLKAMTNAKRQKFHDNYKKILGRNIYNQSLRSYVYTAYNGKYYSDCSSSGMATLKKIGFDVTLLNTAGIYQSSLFEEVPVKIKNGHITNPEVLKVADAILFVGDDSSRPLQIGHVEWVYEINGKVTVSSNTGTASSTSGKSVPTLASASSNLKKGSTGKQVGYLQKDLNYLGFKGKNGKSLTVDGEFGTNTDYALRAFQKKYGLSVDGIYGSKSKAKMKTLL